MKLKAVLLAAAMYLAQPQTEAHREHVVETVENIYRYSHYFRESPSVIIALAIRESRMVPGVVGKRGECGSLQVMGWHLREKMKCAELQTPEGGVVGGLRALQQWKDYVKAKTPQIEGEELRKNARACYASGNWCASADSERTLRKVHADLQGAGAGFSVLSGAVWLTL